MTKAIGYNPPYGNNVFDQIAIGAHYNKIMGIIGFCRVNGLKYFHRKIKSGHNYKNDPEWDDKWDDFFNLKQISEYDENITYFEHPFDIISSNPVLYYETAIKFVREFYKVPEHIKVHDKYAAIHIRVPNSCDTEPWDSMPGGVRFISLDMYKYAVEKLKNEGYEIHIFTQENFDKSHLTNVFYHDDMDQFDTMHYMINASVLVVALSSFSYVAGLYNKNRVMYFSYYRGIEPLSHWERIC